MLVNPVEDNWWEFLTLDTGSGVMAPRYLETGFLDPRGLETLKVFKPLTYESVIEGRYRSIERLREAVQLAVDAGDNRETQKALGEAVTCDDFGVAAWFALGLGADEYPFDALRTNAALWQRFIRLTVRQQYARQ